MDVASLHNILLHTFSNDEAARKAAEEAVASLHTVPGSVQLLLQITVEQSVTREIRQAAAVSLKNLVQKYWEGADGPEGQWVQVISPADKVLGRQNGLEALLVAQDSSIRSLLAETVAYIARFDFPESWPTLIDDICKNVQSGDANRIINSLLALRRVVKNFEYRSEERLTPLFTLVEGVFPMLQNMMVQMQTNNSIEAANMMHLILKTYWSCVKTNLPPHIAQTDQVVAWMNIFSMIIAKRLPEASEGGEPAGQPTDVEERNNWPWWKLKKWSLQILCRFYTRYGNPKKAEEEYVQMSTVYRNQIAPELLPCVMETLALRKNGRFCTDRVIQLALVFLQEAVDSAVTYKLIKPHLGFLLFEVIHPVLCLTPKDLQLWAEDPHEFVRKTNDVFEDFLDPVYAASNLLADLCTKRGKDCLMNVLSFYNNILNTYLTSPDDKKDFIQKDAALHALFSLDGVLTKSKAHKDQVESMIVTHILPEFKNPHGFLRLRACKIFSRKYIEGIKFKDEQTLISIVNYMLDAMFDPELPVRIEAAKTIRFVVMYPHSDTVVKVLRPRLPQILEQFFSLMDEIGNDEVVVALEHIIDRFSSEIGPYSLQLVAKFVEFFGQFTAAARDDEDASLAAVSCLDAINTILMSIHNHQELYALLVPTLAPVIRTILTEFDYAEYMESCIDILGSLAFYSHKITPELWSLFPLIFASFLDWASDYITNFVPVIDNFVGRDIDGFLAGSTTYPFTQTTVRYLDLVLDMAKRVFDSSSTQEVDLCAACRLLYSLLHNLFGKIDECIPSITLMVCNKLAEPLVDSTARNLLGVFGSLLHYNPALTLESLTQLGAADGVLKIWLSDLSRYDNFLDRKLFILGAMSILRAPADKIPAALRPHMKQLIQAAMKVLAESIQNSSPGDEGEDVDNEAEEGEQLEELLDNGGYASNEDAEDVVDDQYYAILRQLREEAEGQFGNDDESDDEYISLLDEVDEVEFFLNSLQHFAQTHTGEYQALGLEADATTQQALKLFQAEHVKRKEAQIQKTQE
ncbi:ran binding protein 7 [Plasmopara halstedii]|uniref:Ran binding protein 7 n=1 Tax=Plasmopara halstedii TaxID=4781 RepID=A0A0N7L3B0_PLAHL|nr:ran binding protein 7 [Plasmopara halstedii]CEG35371.1 ran binding protein 7 [Plasmopara halstedii]|eukprot:XP_024571740.1 ran binding protein 7 [Plasmopara halstedii]